MPFEKDPNEIGALWEKSSARGPYMTGKIEGIGAVVLFKCKPSEKGPTWRVMKPMAKDAPALEGRYRSESTAEPMTAREQDASRARQGRPVFDRQDDGDPGW